MLLLVPYDLALAQLNPTVVDNISLGVYISLRLGKLKDASKWLKQFPSGLKDSFIYNLTASWFELFQFGDTLNSSFYHYDEISSNDSTTTLKSLVCLLVANLKNLHFPEAKDVLNKIESLAEEKGGDFDQLKAWKADLLIDEISYGIITGDAEYDSKKLLKELETLDPSNEYLVDLKEKNELFDGIVAKYAS
ncbi:unnamed protein product [Ambrosiozyma monospora]|uniref:Unnamed protein product n=1 Tax=Ambrosiozyma monospora TaxID=43982 RepID=A0ACB5U504_AMBMO|nr:unnamed protein product [Ambrosiozyma monospora]